MFLSFYIALCNFFVCCFRNTVTAVRSLSPIFRTFFHQVDRRQVPCTPRMASMSMPISFIFFDCALQVLRSAIRTETSFSALHIALPCSHAPGNLLLLHKQIIERKRPQPVSSALIFSYSATKGGPSMRKYTLASPESRSTVDLRDYRAIIESSVQEIMPAA